jgi:hypothetical protein
MKLRTAQVTIVVFALTAATQRSFAAAAVGGLVAGDARATFAFTTTVRTPKGTKSGAGTVIVKRSGEREIMLTVESNDGSPSRSIPLIIGVDGSVAPDPSAVNAAPADPTAKAQAAAFMSAVTIAAHVGIAARKNGGASNYSVPVKLTPIGNGTPVTAELAMSGAPAQYTGTTQGRTQTELPPGGGLDPAEIAKTLGVGAFAHREFGPAGRIGTAVVMHRKHKEKKADASGPLPDDVRLTVTAELDAGKIRQIRGAQTDGISIGGKPVQIESTWSFTRTSS